MNPVAETAGHQSHRI